MDTLMFLSELKRMCNSYKSCSLSPCPLYKDGIFNYCHPQGIDTSEDIERVLNTVEKWSKEHPKRTYLSVFLEKFPKTKLNDSGVPRFCICNLGFDYCSICIDDCKTCWNREYKE